MNKHIGLHMTGHLKSVYSLIGFITSDDFSAWSAKNQALFLPLPLPLRSGSRPANVQALAAPHFSEALRECSVREGRDASFQGVVTGSRPLSVSWLHNGECAITKTNVPLPPPHHEEGSSQKGPAFRRLFDTTPFRREEGALEKYFLPKWRRQSDSDAVLTWRCRDVHLRGREYRREAVEQRRVTYHR